MRCTLAAGMCPSKHDAGISISKERGKAFLSPRRHHCTSKAIRSWSAVIVIHRSA